MTRFISTLAVAFAAWSAVGSAADAGTTRLSLTWYAAPGAVPGSARASSDCLVDTNDGIKSCVAIDRRLLPEAVRSGLVDGHEIRPQGFSDIGGMISCAGVCASGSDYLVNPRFGQMLVPSIRSFSEVRIGIARHGKRVVAVILLNKDGKTWRNRCYRTATMTIDEARAFVVLAKRYVIDDLWKLPKAHWAQRRN